MVFWDKRCSGRVNAVCVDNTVEIMTVAGALGHLSEVLKLLV